MRSSGWRRVLLATLAAGYPVGFFAANNWYSFAPEQIVMLMTLVPALGLAVIAVLSLFLARALRTADAAWAAVALATGLWLSGNLYASTPVPEPAVWLILASIGIGGTLWASRRGLAALNGVLLLLCAITAAQWLYSYLTIRAQLLEDSWHNAHREFNEQIEFSRKPNIYYILSESYPNRETLQAVFGIEQNALYRKLERAGFVIAHDALSNYDSTALSQAALFAMNHHYREIALGELDSYSGRDVISGRVYNAVLDVLWRNGYVVQYVHETNYQLRRGHAVDYAWPDVSPIAAIKSFLTPLVDSKWLLEIGESRNSHPDGSIHDFQKILSARLKRAFESGVPHFTYIYHTTPGHSSWKLGAGRKRPDLVALEAVRDRHHVNLGRANDRIEELVAHILAGDPQGLIVVAGDHGPWGYRRTGDASISARTFALDRLGILLAIRFPDPPDERLLSGPMTLVNLFRVIFADLSGNHRILESRVPDDGFLADEVLNQAVADGRVLDRRISRTSSPE